MRTFVDLSSVSRPVSLARLIRLSKSWRLLSTSLLSTAYSATTLLESRDSRLAPARLAEMLASWRGGLLLAWAEVARAGAGRVRRRLVTGPLAGRRQPAPPTARP